MYYSSLPGLGKAVENLSQNTCPENRSQNNPLKRERSRRSKVNHDASWNVAERGSVNNAEFKMICSVAGDNTSLLAYAWFSLPI